MPLGATLKPSIVDETLGLRDRPWIAGKLSAKTLRLRSRLTTLTIYQDLVADHKVPLQASSQALPLVPYNSACGVLFQAANQALLQVCYFKAYLPAFKPLASPHSLGRMIHECKFRTALILYKK
jgi:hypothetical protein